MAKDDVWGFEIPGWEKYNPANKKVLWHRVDSTIIGRGEFDTISASARLLWFILLCHRATSGTKIFQLTTKNVCRLASIKPNRVPEVVRELTDLEWLRVVKTPLARALRTHGRTDGRTDGGVAKADASAPSAQLALSEAPKKSGIHPFAELWNRHCGDLPKVLATTKGRLKRCRERWGERKPEEWAVVVERMADSDFCQGKNDRGWVADFDFLLKPDSWAKVIEGKYDNRVPKNEPRYGTISGIARDV